MEQMHGLKNKTNGKNGANTNGKVTASTSEAPFRVAQIIGKAVISGVDSVVMNYYRHIDRSRVQFDFFMDGYDKTLIDEEILDLGGRIIKLEPYEKSMLTNIKQCRAVFEKNGYSIVHSHLNTLSVFPLYAAYRAKVPVRIAHNHSTTSRGEFKRNMIKQMLRPFSKTFATHYAACAEYPGRWLFGAKAVRAEKVRLIKNAVDTERFYPNLAGAERIRKEFGLENRFIVGHVGRFVFPKNHEFIVRVFAEAYRQNKNTALLLVGTGELEADIRRLVKELGIENAVFFAGLRRDIPDFLNAFDVFFLPSRYEGMPVVGIEAQAVGLPCLMSDAVPQDTAITPLVSFFPLNVGINEWAQKLLSYEHKQKKAYPDLIRNSGFDIVSAAENLCTWYEKLQITAGAAR
ncbi:glycosyltransferase family 1 protein [Treponema lecithinolyticum]|uniref:Glycosyltransferase, group 1 family protein n=1 Tax=Treponema lecithinolyticum ATCC 700332 TaxID=1321815 RepID=A0ABN0P385_TRELE|nr:glycosyltransferase family 1 protein [Treponema lecithinolyticum]ERJ94498.1 glycosyltransferase, group 1 family protein [Treponema lecithinolyticum ATCC 700332]